MSAASAPAPAGELIAKGRLVDASNATFLAVDEAEKLWLYKPVAGEAPLWDFPDGTLGRREVAAYAVSAAAGFDVVPPTVWVDGPFGEGSAQEWLDGTATALVDLIAPEALTRDWLPVLEARTQADEPVLLAHRDDPRLRRIALFDVLVNNADRKASHLIEADVRVAGVDHGVTFHVEDKLRTVLWGWAGSPLSEAELALVARVAALNEAPAPGLDDDEWAALTARAEAILAAGSLPLPSGRWPAIPWPPL